jgi:prevent-host-death family protein
MYNRQVDVPISELRSNLRAWVERARKGDDVVITERGVPVARLTPVDSMSVIERLEREGVITRPAVAKRPRASARTRVEARGSVSDLVAELRRR